MQQNILLYSEAKTARPFWWSSLDFWVVWAFSRLTTSEDWPFWPLRGLKGQISGLSASLRPGQPRNLARQPKKSCCFSSLQNTIVWGNSIDFCIPMNVLNSTLFNYFPIIFPYDANSLDLKFSICQPYFEWENETSGTKFYIHKHSEWIKESRKSHFPTK